MQTQANKRLIRTLRRKLAQLEKRVEPSSTHSRLLDQVQRLAVASMQERGLSHSKLAARMKLSRPQVTRYMQGEIRTLKVLARVFESFGLEIVLNVKPLRKTRSTNKRSKAR